MKSKNQESILNCFLEFTNVYLDKPQHITIETFLKQNMNSFIKKMLSAKCGDSEKKLIMVANFFKLSNNSLDTIKYLDNYWYIPTFRDPRAQYVGIIDNGDSIDLRIFIDNYKIIRKRFEENLKNGILKTKRTMVVQFEDLVLSDNYRRKIVSSLGIDLNKTNQTHYFKSVQSMPNVFNYHNYIARKDIRLIESELSEYLYTESALR